MYKYKKARKSQIKTGLKAEGETIEKKVERIVLNKEPIKDGAPEIYTERKDGVLAAYNIRTDRWEIACDAMTVAEKGKAAKREGKPQKKVDVKETEVIVNTKGSDEPKS